jgi:hypothetical protein
MKSSAGQSWFYVAIIARNASLGKRPRWGQSWRTPMPHHRLQTPPQVLRHAGHEADTNLNLQSGWHRPGASFGCGSHSSLLATRQRVTAEAGANQGACWAAVEKGSGRAVSGSKVPAGCVKTVLALACARDIMEPTCTPPCRIPATSPLIKAVTHVATVPHSRRDQRACPPAWLT